MGSQTTEGGNSELFNSKKILLLALLKEEGRVEGRKDYRIPGARVTDRKDLWRRQLLPETLLVAEKEGET